MAYKTYWEIEIRHDGLGKYRHIRGSDKNVVEQKAHYQKLEWDDQWQRKLDADQRVLERKKAADQRLEEARERERIRLESMQEKERAKERATSEKARRKEDAQRYKDARKQEAEDRDTAAKAVLDTLRNTLSHTLNVNDAIDWNKLKDTTTFEEPPPQLVLPPPPGNLPVPTTPTPEIIPFKPVAVARPYQPERNAVKYQPVFGFLDRLITSRKIRKVAESEAQFQKDHAAWVAECTKLDEHDASELRKWEDRKKNVENKNEALRADWERAVEKTKTENSDRKIWWEKNCEQIRVKHGEARKYWEQRREKFYERQEETNAAIDQNRVNYMAREPDAVADYCDAVLSNSAYPNLFPKKWDLDYVSDSRTLVVEYALPAPEALPTLKEVQYIQTKDSFKESYLSEKEHDVLYDNLLYQVAIRTLHEIFESDTAKAVDSIVFNGLVTSLDKTSGHNITICVLSLQARKETFMKINLANVVPRACFISLKGVSASKLVGLTPISPVLMIDKRDRRFIDGYAVADSIHSGTNLATMDWEDFEHLIREVFEKEFATGGGEVKVTQASRDGGVDAVAFDPDPIRGGKIVIQAKRYSNTVGVSAVRDLYGTVINEGATKGVLVTTANYGPDAYEFAQGKPLTLLNGSNLLHLLEKHGHQARINLQEAKLLKE